MPVPSVSGFLLSWGLPTCVCVCDRHEHLVLFVHPGARSFPSCSRKRIAALVDASVTSTVGAIPRCTTGVAVRWPEVRLPFAWQT